MADELTDTELRKQLIALGEKNIGPITDTTRAIYRKKLNHLRAAERKATRGKGRAQTGRKLVALSSDESDAEEARPPAPARGRKSRSSTGGKSGRNAPKQIAPRPSASAPGPRRSLRGRRSVVPEPEPESESEEEDEAPTPPPSRPSRTSMALQVSMNNTMNYSHYDQPDSIEVSDPDSDPDLEPNDSQDENVSPNFTQDDSSFFNRTWSKWMGNGNDSRRGHPKPRSTSTPEAGRLLRHRVSLGNTSRNDGLKRDGYLNDSKHITNNVANNVGNHYSKKSKPLEQSSLLSEEENLAEHGFKTEEDPAEYSSMLYISKILVTVVVLFFLALAFGYLAISGPAFNDKGKFDIRVKGNFDHLEVTWTIPGTNILTVLLICMVLQL